MAGSFDTTGDAVAKIATSAEMRIEISIKMILPTVVVG
jgi:hypothetical protein